MIKNKSVLVTISARGGSKGLPGKNILDLAGQPLIAWTIQEALKSSYVDRVVLSTEDENIRQTAIKHGAEAPFLRPQELAQDDTPGIDPVIHVIEQLPEDYDYVLLLQPTSPLRTAEDIDRCLEFCIERDAKCCVSVFKTQKHAYHMATICDDEILAPLMHSSKTCAPRQALPDIYEINGAIFLAKRDWLIESRSYITEDTYAYIMPQERSLDIDTQFDFELCEMILKKRLES